MKFELIKNKVFERPDGGVFVHYSPAEESTDKVFLMFPGDEFAVLKVGDIRHRKECCYEEIMEKIGASGFWSLEDFSFREVFGGHRYTIVIRNKTGQRKSLVLSNPEYSACDSIKDLVSFVEGQLLS
ncbi:MAG: hypothetical protein ACI9NQ_000139 [Paracoccaceae bacterium]|jgi:hypothetical protein